MVMKPWVPKVVPGKRSFVDASRQRFPGHRVRVATRSDRGVIRDIHLRAFPESENQLVAKLAESLLDEVTDPETITLVAEAGGNVVGHIVFSPVRSDTDKHWLGYILAPLGVIPEYQKTGIGSSLINSGIEQLSAKKINVLFVYGDPGYYGRFGFSVEVATPYIPPYDIKYPFGWQARIMDGTGHNVRPVSLSCVPSLCDPALW